MVSSAHDVMFLVAVSVCSRTVNFTVCHPSVSRTSWCQRLVVNSIVCPQVPASLCSVFITVYIYFQYYCNYTSQNWWVLRLCRFHDENSKRWKTSINYMGKLMVNCRLCSETDKIHCIRVLILCSEISEVYTVKGLHSYKSSLHVFLSFTSSWVRREHQETLKQLSEVYGLPCLFAAEWNEVHRNHKAY